MVLLLLAIVAVMVWIGWLVDPRHGVLHHWNAAPDAPLSFRVRYGSPLATLLWLGRRGNCGLALFGVVHIREHSVTASLLAHEVGHLIRMRGDTWNYLWRYVLVPSFRAAEERACWDFAAAHRDDPVIVGAAAVG